jgi:hypothetical protein
MKWADGSDPFRTSDCGEFKLRVGDYRVLYEFDTRQGRILPTPHPQPFSPGEGEPGAAPPDPIALLESGR